MFVQLQRFNDKDRARGTGEVFTTIEGRARDGHGATVKAELKARLGDLNAMSAASAQATTAAPAHDLSELEPGPLPS